MSEYKSYSDFKLAEREAIDALLELGLPSDVNKLDDRMKELFCRATELCYYG